MSCKSIKMCLANTLEDLTKQNFDKFCHQLLDRREEPKVRRNRVEGKNFLDITDVLVSTFTEAGALHVAVEILRQIGCNAEAEELEKQLEDFRHLILTMQDPQHEPSHVERETLEESTCVPFSRKSASPY